MPIYGAALMGGGSGPAFAAIGAIYPVGAVCTCSYNGQTLTAKDTSGRALFLVPSAGQWLVKASNGGQEVEDTVSITTQGQVASVTLAFFSATIQATFPTNCTSVTCTKGDTALSVPSGELSKGSYTFSVHEAGEWTVSCTDGTNTASKVVSITAEGQSESVTLSYAVYLFKSGEGAKVDFTYPTSGNCTASVETDKITIWNTMGTEYNLFSMYTKETKDLSGFSKLIVECKCTAQDSRDEYKGQIRVSSSTGTGTSNYVARSVFSNNSENTQYVVDLTSLSGDYYIVLWGVFMAEVYNIYLEY